MLGGRGKDTCGKLGRPLSLLKSRAVFYTSWCLVKIPLLTLERGVLNARICGGCQCCSVSRCQMLYVTEPSRAINPAGGDVLWMRLFPHCDQHCRLEWHPGGFNGLHCFDVKCVALCREATLAAARQCKRKISRQEMASLVDACGVISVDHRRTEINNHDN